MMPIDMEAEVERFALMFARDSDDKRKFVSGLIEALLASRSQTDASRSSLDELRERVKTFEAFVHERRDAYEQMAQRDECDFPVDSHAFAAMQMAFNEAIVRGLELGLWK